LRLSPQIIEFIIRNLWLWGLEEEPNLWRRYAYDGSVLLRLAVTRALPLSVLDHGTRSNPSKITINLSGDANEHNIGTAIACFRETLTKGTTAVAIDLSGVRAVDGRFLGLLLMVRKRLKGQGTKLEFFGVSPAIRRLFWLNELGFLLSSAIEKA